jgi:hypothetical protein
MPRSTAATAAASNTDSMTTLERVAKRLRFAITLSNSLSVQLKQAGLPQLGDA